MNEILEQLGNRLASAQNETEYNQALDEMRQARHLTRLPK